MKFLLDMDLSPRTAVFLREQGCDAIHLREQGLHQLEDEDIVLKAVEERRILLVHDLDFGRIVALSRASAPSIITFRLQDMRPDNVNQFVLLTLTQFSTALTAGALVSVNEQTLLYSAHRGRIGQRERANASRAQVTDHAP